MGQRAPSPVRERVGVRGATSPETANPSPGPLSRTRPLPHGRGGAARQLRRYPRERRCRARWFPRPGAGPLSRAGEGQGEGCDLSGDGEPLTRSTFRGLDLSRTGEVAARAALHRYAAWNSLRRNVRSWPQHTENTRIVRRSGRRPGARRCGTGQDSCAFPDPQARDNARAAPRRRLPERGPGHPPHAAFLPPCAAILARLRRICVVTLRRSGTLSSSRMKTMLMSGRTLAKEPCSAT